MTRALAPALDNPAWSSLTGAHSRFAVVHGLAARYDHEVAPFHALADPADPLAWNDLAHLVEPDDTVTIAGAGGVAHPGWQTGHSVGGVQLVDVSLRSSAAPDAVRLGAADVPDILDLVDRTQPGPFRRRTVELGTYLGLRSADGRLIAMAGERLHPHGWTEISAVCTDPAHRKNGLATRLIRAVAAGIRDRGETPFLHTSAGNVNAIRLYESIGFVLRARTDFTAYHRTPPGA
ncbi:GNAT family N-acetyltransferase [Actinoplanes sp. NEAU-A12]|uniref:GNAT family N-acetyltransferase n=1 Tax=Actinoplanes sandaracinus TaxID=3045177 RepID=A0ABT6WWN9_9ACTN|nr:GNAT family N-acetyltransferase [Actinoplanes sandaracinus]MDI6104031.1 GNAT family N-acetyltransferase [Actinoplanes sandaracinus]